jgi:hypothetical protein
VKFGPQAGKVCPDTVPVVKPIGVGFIGFRPEKLGVPCNDTVHPAGLVVGDEPCEYSECESGGSYSAICGCIQIDENGPQWICLHSTCNCTVAGAGAGAGASSAPVHSNAFMFMMLVSSLALLVLVEL